jgi:hypothetical protein
MGSDYTKFSNDFRICKQHMTETVFWKEYNVLRNTWPEDVLTCYRLKYKNGALITAKDIVNLMRPMGGGSIDAYQLLQKLQQLQSKDARWFVRFKVDITLQ